MTFRYSNINTAYTCYRKYQIEVLIGKKPNIESVSMHFGTAMHLAMSVYFKEKDDVNTLNVFNMYWDSCNHLDFSKERNSFDDLRNKGSTFISRFIRLHANSYRPMAVEESINFNVEGYSFSGTPDFVGYYKDKPAIVDFKTSHAAYDKEKILTNEQMYIYAHAVEQTSDFKIENLVYTVFVKNPEPRIQQVVVPLDRELMKINLDNVAMMCEDLSNRQSWPMNKNSCSKCPYKEICYVGKI